MKAYMQTNLRKNLMLPDLVVLKILANIINADDAEDGNVQFEENSEQYREILLKFYEHLLLAYEKIVFFP